MKLQRRFEPRLTASALDFRTQRSRGSRRDLAAPLLLPSDLESLGDSESPPSAALVGHAILRRPFAALLDAHFGVVEQRGVGLAANPFGTEQLCLASANQRTELLSQ